jgi:hypothetical protein
MAEEQVECFVGAFTGGYKDEADVLWIQQLCALISQEPV